MIKYALEVPDNIDAWEDTVRDYMDKHYPYLSDGIANVGFMKKEENTKDGIGEVAYDHNGIQISIPIIIDDGNLLEPNLGIYKDQVVPISEDVFGWIQNNSQDFGQLIERDSQHIGSMDYLQQTGLFEEPDIGGYKSACLKATADKVRKIASQYPELKWLTEAIDKTSAYNAENALLAEDISGKWGKGPLNYRLGEYATVSSAGIPKVASAIADKYMEEQLTALPKAISPYKRVAFTHKYADKYAWLKQAEDGAKENELIKISDSDTFGEYYGVMANDHGTVNNYEGRVWFDIKQLIEKSKKPISMMIISGEPKASDPEPKILKKTNNIPKDGEDRRMHHAPAVIGDLYGVKQGYHTKKDEYNEEPYPPLEGSYNMGDNIMIRLGKNSYSSPYIVDSKVSGLIGPNMENVTVITIMSPFDYNKADVIVADVAEVKTIRVSSIKDHQLKSMLRTDNTTAYMAPAGSVVRAPKDLMFAADKGKMIAEIISGMPQSDMSAVVKISGEGQATHYTINYNDGGHNVEHETKSEKVANALTRYYLGDETTAKEAAEEGVIPIEYRQERKAIDKIAECINANRDAFIEAAAKLPRSISPHFSKVASVANIVDDLIGVSFVDNSREADTKKIAGQILSLINSLGNLIILARLGKASIPESALGRSFWSLAELLGKIRG